MRRLTILVALAGCGSREAGQPPQSAARETVAVAVEASPWDTMTTTPADTTPALLFVLHDDADATIMLPLLVVDSGELQRPPDDSVMVRQWYGWGTRYRLLRGNAAAGSVAVIQAGEPNQCNPTMAYVRYYEEASSRPPYGLATNSTALGNQSIGKRAVTSQERQLLDGVAVRVLRDSLGWAGDPPPLSPSVSQAISIDSSGQPALAGVYGMSTDSGYLSLLVVLEHTRSWYEATLALSHRSDPEDGREWPVWELVDVIHLDDNGVAELVLAVTGIESTSYQVYQRGDELWRETFAGALLTTC